MSDKMQRLVEAIEEVDLTNEDHTIASGAPNTNVLAGLIGEDVTAAERDEAWKLYLEQQEAAEKATVEKDKNTPAVTGQDALKALRNKGMKI